MSFTKCKKHKKKLVRFELDVFGKKKNVYACPVCFKSKLNVKSLIQEVVK